METEKLKFLKVLLEEFYASDIFGLGEMEYLPKIAEAIELVEGAITSNELEEM